MIGAFLLDSVKSFASAAATWKLVKTIYFVMIILFKATEASESAKKIAKEEKKNEARRVCRANLL